MVAFEKKGCWAIARQRADTAPARAQKARDAGHMAEAVLTSLEGVIATALMATLWRAAWAYGIREKPVAVPQPKPQVRKPKRPPLPHPSDPDEFDYPGRMPTSKKPTRTESIRAASLAEYGDPDYVRAMHEVIRTKGHPRPIWPGLDAWEIVRGKPDVLNAAGGLVRKGTGDADFAAYLESLKSDSDWFALAPEGRSRRRTASSALGDGARTNRQRRMAEARAAAEAAAVEAELDDFDPASEDFEDEGQGSGGGPGALPLPTLKPSPRSH